MLRLLILLLIVLTHSPFASAVAFTDPTQPLELNENVTFAVSEEPILTGNEKWVSDASLLERSPLQYLHFKVRIDNQLEKPIPVWFSISFPAVKKLMVTDGEQVWISGDSLPYHSRPVAAPNYHFPTILSPKGNTEFSGYMSGEILRYNFSIATPEYFNNLYVKTLQRDMTFFGAMWLLTALSILGYIASRNLVFLSFASFIFATTFWFFRVFGYAFELLWPNTPGINDISYAVSVYLVLITAFWILFQTLAREKHAVYGTTTAKIVCISLPFVGLLLWHTAGLDIALKLPVLMFFPYTCMAGVVIYIEHKRGSDRAKWLAAAMLPVVISTLILTVVALFDVELFIEPIATFMTGLVMTCLFMVSLAARYMVKMVQRERDAQRETAVLKSQQASKLEALVKERTLALEQTNKALAELASKDSLTALSNRRTLDLFVDNSFEKHSQTDRTLALALIDLDHFKRINDTFGHEVGDDVLKAIASVLLPLNTPTQLTARYGGEEFAIVRRFDPTANTQQQTEAFANELIVLHGRINQLDIASLDDRKIGACIGWTLCKGSDDIVEAFRRADKALYVAKDKGRNLIVPAL